jgi:hypothetical protein
VFCYYSFFISDYNFFTWASLYDYAFLTWVSLYDYAFLTWASLNDYAFLTWASLNDYAFLIAESLYSSSLRIFYSFSPSSRSNSSFLEVSTCLIEDLAGEVGEWAFLSSSLFSTERC